MVKGVSKTVIVVNDTGSKFFEKIVFYVTPEYGRLNAKQLKRAANDFALNFEGYQKNGTLRKRYKKKQNIRLICLLGFCVAVLGLVLAILL